MKEPTFVAKIDLSLAEKLKSDLTEQGFTFSTPPYTIFSAQKKGISISLYTSGKLTVQGKDKDPFITYYLEPEILKTFTYTHPEAYADLRPRIGIDEAGKGDFFGPLCIAGVYADEEGVKKLIKMSVRDSKRLSDDQVLKLAKEIKKHFTFTEVKIFPTKYNELYTKFKNLNHLLGWGHATAIETLVAKTACHRAIIDQFADERVVEEAIRRKNLELELTQRHKGEEDPVVAAASILARAAFLEGIEALSKEIEFELPKGASSQVLSAGKKLIAEKGKEILNKVAKVHFKTFSELFLLLLIPFFFFFSSLNGLGLGYSCFVFKEHPVYFCGTYTGVGEAEFYHPENIEHTHLHYDEAAARGFFSHFFNPKDALTFQLGYLHYHLGWPENPSFHQTNFNDIVGTIAFTSRRPDCFFWTVEIGTRMGCEHFNLSNNAIYYGTIWGQYAYENFNFHLGFTGHTGIEKSYALPIFGVEWQKEKWKLTAVFPIELSLKYCFTECWSALLSYNGFGGRYRANHRTGSDEPLPKAVYQLFSTGLDAGLCFGYKMIRLSLFGGWNFGGWIYIQNRHGEHGQYYKFNGAPYGTFNGSIIF